MRRRGQLFGPERLQRDRKHPMLEFGDEQVSQASPAVPLLAFAEGALSFGQVSDLGRQRQSERYFPSGDFAEAW